MQTDRLEQWYQECKALAARFNINLRLGAHLLLLKERRDQFLVLGNESPEPTPDAASAPALAPQSVAGSPLEIPKFAHLNEVI